MPPTLSLGTRKGFFHLVRGTVGWRIERTAFLGDHVCMLVHDPRSDTLLAALDHGHFGTKLQRSRDRGRSWEECAVPEYPTKPADLEEKDQWGKPREWKLAKIWSLEPGGSDQKGRLWCGTLPGGLFRSDDDGTSWALVESLWYHPKRTAWFGGGADHPGIHSVCVDPRDPACLYAAVSCGGVWYSPDGGASWENRSTGMWAAYMPPEMKDDPNIQDVHRLVQCRESPDVLWAQHHNGVFRTVDGGRNWQEVPAVLPSVFGFAVAVHPNDPNTAWFVPGIKDEKRIPVDGKVVVSRTRDGGKTFEVLTRGLPQEHAYDIVFRHGLDVDASGSLLAMGSSTGALWISEDQGDSWSCVNAHLPQIYCVRFGPS